MTANFDKFLVRQLQVPGGLGISFGAEVSGIDLENLTGKYEPIKS
jgi:hypothetical protein